MNKSAGKTNKKGIFAGSVILSALDRFCAAIYRGARNGLFGRIFTSYDDLSAYASRGVFAGLAQGIKKKSAGIYKIKHAVSGSFERSAFVEAFLRFTAYMRATYLRVWSLFFLMFGMFGGLVYFIKRIGQGDPNTSTLYLWIFAISLIISIPFNFSKKTLGRAILDSKIMSLVLFDFFGLRREWFDTPRGGVGRRNLAAVFGILLGTLTYFVPPLYLLLAAVGAVALYTVLLSPEAGVFAVIFILPFLVVLPHPSLILCLLVAVVAFSYVAKVVRGKRVLKFDLMDFFVLFFMGIMLFGGLVSLGGASLNAAVVYICLMLGYFLVVNLMRTRGHIERAAYSLVLSAALVSAYGIYQYLTGSLDASKWLDTDMFSEIAGRAVSTFENPNMLGEYLIIAFPIALALMFSAKTRIGALSCLASSALIIGCTVLTWARGAWLGVIFGTLLFVVMCTRRSIMLFIAGAVAAPFAITYLPETIVSRFTSIGNLSDGSTSYRVYIWRAALNMIRDFWDSGIGIGESAYTVVYPYYTLSGIEAAPHTHNLYLQIGAEVGAVGLVVFLIIVFLLLQSGFTAVSKAADSRMRLLSAGTMCGVVAALTQGMTDYVWYNYRVFFVFWAVIGLCAACRRICKDEFSPALDLSDDNHRAEIDMKF